MTGGRGKGGSAGGGRGGPARPIPDRQARAAAVAERDRNLVIDAGAGTGKTTLLVERLVAMVAPAGDAEPVGLARIAAVTFTRKAAGELRLRIRERLLGALAEERDDRRREQLRGALGALDTAHVGTIHSFADRLLRLRPMQARLSPGFEIAEDPDALVRETLERMLRGAETGRLEDEVGPERLGELGARASEAEHTIRVALDAGIKTYDVEHAHGTQFHLEGLVAALIAQRDLPEPEVALGELDRARFDHVRERVRAEVGALEGENRGTWFLRRVVRELDAIGADTPPADIYRHVRSARDRFGGSKKNKLGTKDFPKDRDGWAVYKRCTGAGTTDVDVPLLDQLQAPLERWLAARLMRLGPVACAVYDAVKVRHRQVDQLDLLIRLRDLLRDDREARAFYQGLFDHVFVDEFQDTDPLQAQVLMYLCEDGARCEQVRDARLRPGALTIVGDPKQSIYRFRRADVGMYDEVRRLLVAQGAAEVELETNFRSAPALIGWLNHRFREVLGESPDGKRFAPESGRVFQQALSAGRGLGQAEAAPAVHAVPYPAERVAPDNRAVEAQVMARYVRWLVERSEMRVEDPVTGARRPVGYGDVAVLAVVTTTLEPLFGALDAEHVPYASRGGSLFLQDPLHRRFLLGLRALSDRDDGIGRAALLRPPFFALDLGDLALREAVRRAERMEGAGSRAGAEWDPDHPEVRAAVGRVEAAEAQVATLRKARFARGVERTARDLLEDTGFARHVASGPNGAQRLARLRELCFVLGEVAEKEALGFDEVTALARDWVERPVALDPPHPVAAGAVQVLTIHQAKGLEFPVVILWDGRGQITRRKGSFNTALRQDRDGRAWHLGLQHCDHEEPADFGLKDREHSYENAELARLVYVAATRARDLLVLPKPDDEPNTKYIGGALLADAPEGAVQELAPYGAENASDEDPWWRWEVEPGAGTGSAPEAGGCAPDASELEVELRAHWVDAAAEAGRDRFTPMAVTAAAQAARAARPEGDGAAEPADASTEPADVSAEPPEDLPDVRTKWRTEGRYGTTFGITVHRALELLLRGRVPDAQSAVERAAGEAGLTTHLTEARADVERTMTTLRDLGIAPGEGAVRLEYPIAGADGHGHLLTGMIDLLAQVGGELLLVDFKTDQPPDGDVARTHAAYLEQLALYERLLRAGVAAEHPIRSALLFTADGALRWRG